MLAKDRTDGAFDDLLAEAPGILGGTVAVTRPDSTVPGVALGTEAKVERINIVVDEDPGALVTSTPTLLACIKGCCCWYCDTLLDVVAEAADVRALLAAFGGDVPRGVSPGESSVVNAACESSVAVGFASTAPPKVFLNRGSLGD